ncbi:hypothetical protein STEG23_011714, partial [Scotinomys teguina]
MMSVEPTDLEGHLFLPLLQSSVQSGVRSTSVYTGICASPHSVTPSSVWFSCLDNAAVHLPWLSSYRQVVALIPFPGVFLVATNSTSCDDDCGSQTVGQTGVGICHGLVVKLCIPDMSSDGTIV